MLPSVVTAPSQRFASDPCCVWGSKDGWLSLNLVIDSHTRQLLGRHQSRTHEANTASPSLKQVLSAVPLWGLRVEGSDSRSVRVTAYPADQSLVAALVIALSRRLIGSLKTSATKAKSSWTRLPCGTVKWTTLKLDTSVPSGSDSIAKIS